MERRVWSNIRNIDPKKDALVKERSELTKGFEHPIHIKNEYALRTPNSYADEWAPRCV